MLKLILLVSLSLQETPEENRPETQEIEVSKKVISRNTIDVPQGYAKNNFASLSPQGPDFSLEGKSTLGSSNNLFTELREGTVIVRTKQGHGSGAIVRNGRFVLTNYHVVSNSAHLDFSKNEDDYPIQIITCKVDGGRPIRSETLDAKIVAASPTNDLALLRLRTPTSNTRAASFNVAVRDALAGDRCLMVGSQGGGLAWSVRAGVVSGNYKYPLDTTDALTNPTPSAIRRGTMSVLVTDCPISSGDSGGPLLNMNGDLIGITFATPTNLSGGATGYHLDTETVRDFLDKSWNEAGIPVDIWGFATDLYELSVRDCYDIDRDGWIDITEFTGYGFVDGELVNLGTLTFFDTSDSINRISIENAKTKDGLVNPGYKTSQVTPVNFWGSSPAGLRNYGSKFIMSRSDGLLITGHLTDNGGLLEQRIELPDQKRPSLRRYFFGGRWQTEQLSEDDGYWNQSISGRLNQVERDTWVRQIKHWQSS